MGNIDVVGLGALNVDHIYQVEQILDDGETVVKDTIVSPGGSAANTIYGLVRLGVNTGFAGIIGSDEDGKILLEDFQTVGVNTSQIRVRAGARTGSTLCLSDSLGKRSIYVLPAVNSSLTLDDLNLSYINQAKMLHMTSFVDEKQFELSVGLMNLMDSSVSVSFSPGALYTIKGLQALSPILTRTRVLFLNRDEIERLTGQDIAAGSETCLKHGCQIVVVTLGKGIRLGDVMSTGYIRDADSEYVITADDNKTVPILDTTGAGDTFAAGFLYGLLKGFDLTECGHLGDLVAQFSMTKIGARPGLPALKQLSQRYQELYHKAL